MNFDRASQFNPIPALSNAALEARIADDTATTSTDGQQATVDGLSTKATLLKSKVQPYGGATSADYIAYGQTLAALEVESAKLPALQAAQSQTRVNWLSARSAFLAKANSIDDNPGAVESTR